MTSSLLWHYTTTGGALGILQSRSLRASDIRFLNDAQEYDLAVRTLRRVMREETDRDGVELPVKLRERVEAVLDGGPRPYHMSDAEEFGHFAACVSETEDDLGQWRGYADGGGFALGFDRNLLDSIATANRCRLLRCVYSTAEHEQMLRKPFVSERDSMQPELQDHWHKAVNRAAAVLLGEFDRLAPRIKHPAFSAEAEWRIVKGPLPYGAASATVIRYRPGKSLPIPYIELPLASPDGAPLIRCITLGPTPHPALASTAIRHAAVASGLADERSLEVRVTRAPYRSW
jgi:hypothetical protein